MIGFKAYADLVWLSAFNSLDPFLLWGASIHGRWCYNLSQAIYQWDDYTLKLLVTKELLKAVPSYMSFRCWSEFWKVLNHHELVLDVTCKTSIEQKPSAHPSKHVTWIQFFALFFCLFLVLCFLCKFCATTCQGLPDATLSHAHIGPGPQFYRLFSEAAGSSCQNGHDLYESDLVARVCCTQHWQWCMHCTASAGIWTGLDLT